MGNRIHGLWLTAVAGLLAAGWAAPSHAIRFDWDFLGGIQGTLNTQLSLGAQWRLEEPSTDIVGIANINPAVCLSACQPHASTGPGDVPGRIQLGLEAEGDFVNQLALDAPGAGSINFDNGTLNYEQYEMTQGVAQISQDLTLNFADAIGPFSDILLFVRYNAFHDFVNYDRECYFPNFYTEEDRARDDARRASGNFGFPTVGRPLYRDCGEKFNEYLGQDFDILDAFVQFRVPMPLLPSGAQITVGEQTINWGESTLLVVNSLNSINPPNVNALFRPAFIDLATVFEPVGAIKLSAALTYNTSFEVFYQYDWEKVEIPPSGGFLSFVDITLGADVNNINPGFGQLGDDPEGNARAEQQLLTAVAATDGQVPVYEEPASEGGQYGAAFTWYLPDLINGTEFRFYYANYHSRFPFLSVYGGDESCLQSVPTGDALTDTVNLLADCPHADVGHFIGAIGESAGGPLGGFVATTLGALANNLPTEAMSEQPNGQPCPVARNLPPGVGPCAEAYLLDSFSGVLEYPEDIHMFGISFNTAFWDIGWQGEIAYRPNLPLQVDFIDLGFAALQPSAPVGCGEGAFTDNTGACRAGTFDDRYAIGIPVAGITDAIQNGGDVVGAVGNLLGVDASAAQALVNNLTASLAQQGLSLSDLGAALGPVAEVVLLSDPPGRRIAFPDYVTEYRDMGPISPGQYIRGYERFDVLQYNLGATYIIGPGNWTQANQIILLFELGATHVPDLPDTDELQIEGPATFYHHSVGDDGTGAPDCPDGVVQGTSEQESGNTRWCGPFQLRFNSTQQKDGFADDFSAGYRIIGILRYENVFPGVSFRPLFIWAHDIYGTAPGPGPNFVEDRKMFLLNLETKIGTRWSVTTGVSFFFDGEPYNYYIDRDFFQVGVSYRF